MYSCWRPRTARISSAGAHGRPAPVHQLASPGFAQRGTTVRARSLGKVSHTSAISITIEAGCLGRLVQEHQPVCCSACRAICCRSPKGFPPVGGAASRGSGTPRTDCRVPLATPHDGCQKPRPVGCRSTKVSQPSDQPRTQGEPPACALIGRNAGEVAAVEVDRPTSQRQVASI